MQKNNFKNVVLTILISISCFVNKSELIDLNIDKVKYNFFNISLILVFIFGIFIYYFLLKTEKFKETKIDKILAALFSIFTIYGESYFKTNSSDLVRGNLPLIIISLMSLIGFYFLYLKTISWLKLLVNRYIDKKESKISKTLDFIFNKHPFIMPFLIILSCWIIYVIAFYPAILSKDPSFQILQFLNVKTKYADYVLLIKDGVFLTNHHPVVHTFLIGGCLLLGRIILNDNFGLFIYSIVQLIILASSLSLTIKYMKKIDTPIKYRIVTLLIYSVVPMYAFHAMNIEKDLIYTALIIVYFIFLFDTIKFRKDISGNKAILLIILLIFTATFRNNGIYVIVLSLPFLLFLVNKRNKIKLSAVLIVVLIIYYSFTKILLPTLGITDGSIREMLSIPFQQTARYVKYYEEDVTLEEKENIDKILEYNTLAERYNPVLSDAVKNKFNKYSAKKDLKDYFKSWFIGLKKHPITYVDATINNTYGYFYPGATNWYFHSKYSKIITENNYVNYYYNGLSGLRGFLEGYGAIFPYIPILGLISNIGFNTWLIMVFVMYLFELNKKRYIIVYLPALVTLLICIASPANTYFRYAMPYIFAMPLLGSIFINILKEKKNEKR